MDDHGRRALEEIYEEFFPRIYNYIYYRLLHREETEDLVSRIFLKVAEHLHEYDPKKAKLDTWIFRIAERTLIDHFRTRRSQLSLEDENAGLENRFRVEFEEEYERILEPGRRAVFAASRGRTMPSARIYLPPLLPPKRRRGGTSGIWAGCAPCSRCLAPATCIRKT